MIESIRRRTVCGCSLAVLVIAMPVAALAQQAESKGEIETVTVTAEKQTESSLDVPMGLTALSGDELVRTQSFTMEDIAGKVPGLTLIEGAGGSSELVIRGLTTGVDLDSPVAVYIDETPYLPSSVFAGGVGFAPDFDTYDMQRIEVLKGPQGTLYGANAAGGILKYVTNAPDPTGFSASVEAGVSSVYNGNFGFDSHAMVNIPLADDLAVRLVAYDNYYPGYIDDPSQGIKDINGTHVTGGRASLLWQPTQDFSIRLNALYQDRKASDTGFGSEDVNPITLKPEFCTLCQERLIGQPNNDFGYVVNATVNWDVGFAKLLSATSYHRAGFDYFADVTSIYGLYTPSLFSGDTYGVAYPYHNHFSTITQEMRLSSEGDGSLQWQVGGYFTQESSQFFGGLFPIDLTTHKILYNLQTAYAGDFPLAGTLGDFSEPVTYREYAAFANVDYHITPDLDVALGGRYSENDQWYTELYWGALFGLPLDLVKKSDEGVFTWSGDVRWHFMPNNMLYARMATGYEPGGPNDAIPGGALPNAYSSATTTNYEVGIKSSLLDNRLTAELALYAIDWHSIQITVDIDGITGGDNGGTAHTRGFEWQFNYVPIDGLTLGFNGSYTDAFMTQVIPAAVTSVGVNVGDRLPYIPLWQGNLSAEYERPLFGEYSGFIGLNERLTASRPGVFVIPPAADYGPRYTMPGYGILDLRLGIESDKYSATFYIKNVGNTLAINNLLAETLVYDAGPQSALLLPPRTIGLSLTAKF